MYAVEFKAKIKDGMIQIPGRYRDAVTDTVKVIILKDDAAARKPESRPVSDCIERLLNNPVKIKGFRPLKRDEIYAGR
ncbi:MAG: hypothetical protein HZA20_05770 [Nitrospirae bacterium]|nr:hypothetical protein [Nitrospirota bacterium]